LPSGRTDTNANTTIDHRNEMTRRLPTLLLLAVMVLVAACSVHVQRAPRAESSASAERAIRAEFDSTAAGWNRGDLETYLGAYDPSVTSAGADGFVTGIAAAREVMQRGFWRAGRPAQALHYEHLVTRMLGPDHALVTGQFVLTGADRPDRTGWFTSVWMRTPAGWRMIHDHS
jgi:ketosteroid isomerase-like protein